MSGKFSTLILTVDLSCCQCNRKIKKLLCKIQDRENIRLIAYDEKNNTVTISGPFDPHCLKKKLYCKACKIIKDIQIPPPPPPPPVKKPDPPPPEKKPDEKKPDPTPEKKPDPQPEKKPDEKKPDPTPEKKPDPQPEKKPDEKKPDPTPEKKPDPKPEKKPDEKKPDPKPEKKPDPPKCEWPPGPVCCTRPCYVGMFGGMKCASCGMVYTWTNQGPPPVMVYNPPPVPRPYYYDGYGYGYGCSCGCGQPRTCQFICEDNTSQCTIM